MNTIKRIMANWRARGIVAGLACSLCDVVVLIMVSYYHKHFHKGSVVLGTGEEIITLFLDGLTAFVLWKALCWYYPPGFGLCGSSDVQRRSIDCDGTVQRSLSDGMWFTWAFVLSRYVVDQFVFATHKFLYVHSNGQGTRTVLHHILILCNGLVDAFLWMMMFYLLARMLSIGCRLLPALSRTMFSLLFILILIVMERSMRLWIFLGLCSSSLSSTLSGFFSEMLANQSWFSLASDVLNITSSTILLLALSVLILLMLWFEELHRKLEGRRSLPKALS